MVRRRRSADHPEGAGHERRQAGVFEMSIDITTPQLNVGANQADAGLALLVDARGIDGKHASHAAGLDIQLQALDYKLNSS